MCLMIIAGCDRQTSQTDSLPAETEQVKTAAEYKAEADQQITEENMTSELDRARKGNRRGRGDLALSSGRYLVEWGRSVLDSKGRREGSQAHRSKGHGTAGVSGPRPEVVAAACDQSRNWWMI